MVPRRHTLLVVDDEIDVLESLNHLFHRHYHVVTASSAERALELLAQQEVHLILADQRMPGMTGDVFLGHARRLYPDAIRMMFTGYADIQAVINAVNQGHIFRYITKPWNPDELEGVIRQAAEQYDLLAERKRLIAELRQANEQLTRANRELAESVQLKTAFIEVASHEFNTPITLILGLAELLKLTNPDREPAEAELIDQIIHGARQLSRLVANTLKLMRAGDYRRPLNRVPTDLARLLHDVVESIQPFVKARDLRLAVDVPEDLGDFDIDPDKVRDAVTNLMTNAIKFTPDGGQIALTARLVEPDQVEIVITDQGIGVEPRELEQFFQPFFTEFDPSHHSSGDFGFKKRGLGLGLSIVKSFIEWHGGRVSAESTPGEGTRITIRLDRHAQTPPSPSPDEAAEPQTPPPS